MHSLSVDYSKLDRPEVVKRLFAPRLEPVGGGAGEGGGGLDHAIEVEAGIRIGCRFHLAGPEDPNILFFHGNGEIAVDYDDAGPDFVAHGMSLLAVDYRGYGRSDGIPTATNLLADAHAIFREIRSWLREQGRTGPLLVMGRSLGSAPALELAAEHGADIDGLIIESGFAFTMPLLECIGVDTAALGLTESDGFRNMVKIGRYTKPTLIIHARNDRIIPVRDAETLQIQSPARGKEFQIVPGADHNNIMAVTGKLYFQVIGRFAARIARARKRPRR